MYNMIILQKKERIMKKYINIDIQGMHCASCSAIIEMTLKNKKGIESISVNLLSGSASMIYDDSEIKPEDITGIINDLGYKAFTAEEGVKKKS